MAALALLALVAAYWSWVWLAPNPQSRAQPVAYVDTDATAASNLFGSMAQRPDSAAATAIAIRLLGIVAATAGHAGYAVVLLEPKQILTVREGDDIAPGLRLKQVSVDHVTLERSGAIETLAWPQKNTSAAPAATPINN